MISVVIAWGRKPFWLALATTTIGCLYLVATPVTADQLLQLAEAMAIAEPGLTPHTPPGGS